MTVNQFRAHQYYPTQWRRELLSNGILQVVLEVLEDAHPTRFPVSTDLQDDLSPTQAALQLGHTRGYSACLNTLRVLAQPIVKPQAIGESTYQEEKKHE